MNQKFKLFKYFQFSISKVRLNLIPKSFNAMLAVKGSRPLIYHMINVTKIVVGGITANWVRLTILLLHRMYTIQKHQGLNGYIKFQKVSCVVLQQVIGGHHENDLTPLGPRISRTKGGLPRILPISVREEIRKGNPLFIKWAMTMFSIYRVVVFNTVPKFSTITDPRVGSLQMERRLVKLIPAFVNLFIGSDQGLVSLSTPSPFPIHTSSPNSDSALGEISSSWQSMLRSYLALWNNPLVHDSLIEFSRLLPYNADFQKLWNMGVDYLQSKIGAVLVLSKRRFSNLLYKDPLVNLSRASYIGKLGLKIEAAGKVRVFAMVDCYTQWLLRPLHRWIFKILRKFPDVDGTFNQLGPINRIPFGKVPLYSFDLSAATDRLPISLQESILRAVFGLEFSSLWRTILVQRDYFIRFKDSKGSLVSRLIRYAVGQPMGALSSWGMLALTHHFIVQSSAWLAGHPRTSLFKGYALLGDDIVIYDKRVAAKYLDVLKHLGVSVGLAKSVISPSGASLEFAKRTIFKGSDVSPVPLKEYSSALDSSAAFCMFVEKYSCSRGVIKALLGLGYKSRMDHMRLRMYDLLRSYPKSVSAFYTLIKSFPLFVESRFGFGMYVQKTPVTTAISIFQNLGIDLFKRIRRAKVSLRQHDAGFAFHDNIISREHWDALYGGRAKKILADLEYAKAILIKGVDDIMGFGPFIGFPIVPKKLPDGLPNGEFVYDPDALAWLDNTIVSSISAYMRAEDLFSRTQVKSLIHPEQETTLSPHEAEFKRLSGLWNLWSRFAVEHVSSSFAMILLLMFRNFKNLFLISRTVVGSLTARQSVLRRLNTAGSRSIMRSFTWKTLIALWSIETIWVLLFSSITYYVLGIIILMMTTTSWMSSSAALFGILQAPLIPTLELLHDFIGQVPSWFVGSPVLDRAWYASAAVYLLDAFVLLTANSVYQNWSDVVMVVHQLDIRTLWDVSLLVSAPLGVLYKFGLQPLLDMIFIPLDYLWDQSPIADAFWNNQWVDSVIATYHEVFSFWKDEWQYFRTGLDPRGRHVSYIETETPSFLCGNECSHSVDDSFDASSKGKEKADVVINATWSDLLGQASSSKDVKSAFQEYFIPDPDNLSPTSSVGSDKTIVPPSGDAFTVIRPVADNWTIWASVVFLRYRYTLAGVSSAIFLRYVLSVAMGS